MSVIEKIQTIEKKYENERKTFVTENDLIDLFGENYNKDEIMINKILSCFVFEEKKTLYYLTICKDIDNMYALIGDSYKKSR